MSEGVREKIKHLSRPEDVIFLFFLILSVVLVIAFTGSFTIRYEAAQHIVLCLLFLASVGLLSNLPHFRGLSPDSRKGFMKRFGSTIRDYLPFLFVLIVYENMSLVFSIVFRETADQALMNIDGLFFGGQPTVFLESITYPVLTDYLILVYSLYLFFPALPALVFTVNNRKRDLRDIVLAITISLYIAYIGYLLVPAIGPKYFMPDAYSIRLHGVFLYQRINPFWEMITSTPRDCFPSHHTAIAVISLYYMSRLRNHSKTARIVYYVYILLAISMIFSTVYLRYHWVTDVAGGVILAVFSIIAARLINRFWSAKMGSGMG